MKRIILLVLSIAIAGTIAITQAQEDTHIPDCSWCETADEESCCGGTVDGCKEDCGVCTECDCDSECEDCTDCEEECTCDTECNDCSCDDCSSEEEIHHCGGCH